MSEDLLKNGIHGLLAGGFEFEFPLEFGLGTWMGRGKGGDESSLCSLAYGRVGVGEEIYHGVEERAYRILFAMLADDGQELE